MVLEDFPLRSLKWAHPAEPFVDHNPQSILVTGWLGLATNLFRSHICRTSPQALGTERLFNRSDDGHAKITEQELTTWPDEHIRRLHIAVNDSRVMGIL